MSETAWRLTGQALEHVTGCTAHDPDKPPAPARSAGYSTRELMLLPENGSRFWKNMQSYTQMVLPYWVADHKDEGWDVVYNACGYLREPHTERLVDLGTAAVRGYVSSWTRTSPPDPRAKELLKTARLYPTVGPWVRFAAVMLIEKASLMPNVEAGKIAEQNDVAIMTTEGMTCTAARQLAEAFAREGVPTFMFTDCDVAGFNVYWTFCHTTKRYQFDDEALMEAMVKRAGLRVQDVVAMDLPGEPVEMTKAGEDGWDDGKDLPAVLRARGVDDEEIAYLVHGKRGGRWHGMRVELNRMTVPQFISWLTRVLTEMGVKKVVPDGRTLRHAYRRFVILRAGADAAKRAMEERAKQPIRVPKRLTPRMVRKAIAGTDKPWEEPVWEVVDEEEDAGGGAA